MNIVLILTCLALYAVHIQGQKCVGLRGMLSPPNCAGGIDMGHLRGSTCRGNANNNMWYYNRDRDACLSMSYLGCGGNYNRWCTKKQCEKGCIRPRGRPGK